VTLLTTLYHFATGFLQYGAYMTSGSTLIGMGMLGSGIMAAAGTFAVLFQGETVRVSRKTGRDKRVSGWPFGDTRGSVTKDQ